MKFCGTYVLKFKLLLFLHGEDAYWTIAKVSITKFEINVKCGYCFISSNMLRYKKVQKFGKAGQYMGGENGNFRSKFFGGFDRRDVIDYIEKLAEERNSLRGENELLQERVSQIEVQLSEKSVENSCRISQLEAELDAERTKSCEAMEMAIEGAEEIVREFRQRYEELRSDVEISLAHTRCEITKTSECVDRMYSAFVVAGTRLDEIEEAISNMKKCSED